MPVTLDPTVGGAGANTYATKAETDDYALATPYAASWAGKNGDGSAGSKEALLVAAARVIDVLPFPGLKVASAQKLQWPRYDVVDAAGVGYSTTVIPQCVKDAQMMLACWMAAQSSSATAIADQFGHDPAAAMEDVTLGPLAFSFRKDAPQSGVDFIERTIVPMLEAGGCIGAMGGVRLTR